MTRRLKHLIEIVRVIHLKVMEIGMEMMEL
jgi:hypothetical protein